MAPKTFRNVVVVLVAVIVGLAVLREIHPPASGQTSARFDGTPADLAAVAEEDKVHPPDQVPPGAYPPAPSNAVGMTPEWRSYADTVDRICALSFNYTLVKVAQLEGRAKSDGWSDEAAEAGVVKLWAQEDLKIHKATAQIGHAPAQPALFRRWRDNVATRTALFFDASDAAGGGNFDEEGRILDHIHRLKGRSDQLGQRFGLRICTSN